MSDLHGPVGQAASEIMKRLIIAVNYSNIKREMEGERPGQAIPFIINKDGEFVVTPEAEDFLKSLSGKQIGVVCIVGKYRTGKSYLINRVILQRTNKDGFKVGPTVNPCTKVGSSNSGSLDLEPDCQGYWQRWPRT